jgi:hypothetical protein
MADPYVWLAPAGMMALGATFAWLALLLLAEYRKAFMADPMSVMSLEVLLAILRCGAPGYIGVIALFGGALLFGSGVLLLIRLLTLGVPHLWQALRLTFGI